MNPGPLFIIRKHFFSAAQPFTFYAIKYSKNTKKFTAFAFTDFTIVYTVFISF
jgi:hypothetical protein